ncbi:hypothetical protein Tco_0987044 [Tanacetum coccineum]
MPNQYYKWPISTNRLPISELSEGFSCERKNISLMESLSYEVVVEAVCIPERPCVAYPSCHATQVWSHSQKTFVEPVEIMDREVKRLKQSRIPIVKVRWNSRRGPEFTWEREDQMQKKYPHLFTNSAPAAEVAS